MVKVLTDENFDGRIIRALQRLSPEMDIARVVDIQPGASDVDVLALAVEEGRVVLTHDRRTMEHDWTRRRLAGLPVPGLIIIRPSDAVGPIVRELLVYLQFEASDFDPPFWL